MPSTTPDDERMAGSDGGDAGEEDSATDTTTSDERRLVVTNDAIALWLTGTFPLVVAAAGTALVDLRTVPSDVLLGWVAITGAAVVWAFGKPAVEAWRGGGG